MVISEDKTIFIIVGPSGSGKTSVGRHLDTIGVPKIITTTSREIRYGERNGIDYNFVSRSEFEETPTIEETEFNGNYYGISEKEINGKLENNDSIYAVMDMNGIYNMRSLFPKNIKVISIEIPESEMRLRMSNRGSSKDEIDSRIKIAKDDGYINNKEADFIINNINFNESKTKLESIVKNNRK